jgi:hypothetical protein
MQEQLPPTCHFALVLFQQREHPQDQPAARTIEESELNSRMKKAIFLVAAFGPALGPPSLLLVGYRKIFRRV